MAEVILHVHQSYEFPHPLRTVSAEDKKFLQTSIHKHGFDYIRGLFVVVSRQSIPKNCENITKLVDGTAHGDLRRNVEVSLADGRRSLAVAENLCELDESHP